MSIGFGAISNKWALISQKVEDIKRKSTKEILTVPLDCLKSILKYNGKF
jgi:hypothetical protein